MRPSIDIVLRKMRDLHLLSDQELDVQDECTDFQRELAVSNEFVEMLKSGRKIHFDLLSDVGPSCSNSVSRRTMCEFATMPATEG